MTETLRKIYSDILKLKDTPSTEMDIRNNIVLKANILLTLEQIISEETQKEV